MGFEDDFDYNDDFETDIADPDNMGGGEQPKKLSRKELREARKKNAEKTAELPRHKKGLFNKRDRLDDNDESLTDDHIFDPTRSTMISTPRDRGSRDREAPIRSKDSEFSYLFDPVDDNESEDDVYPETSIYSDSGAAKDLLAGLSYDGTDNSDPEVFDRYFDEHSKPPESKFSFRKKKQEEQPPEPEAVVEKPEPPKPAPVKVVPKKAEPPEETDSFLPDLRPGSVFAPQPETEPPTEPIRRNDPPLPPLPGNSPKREERRYHDSSSDYYDDYDNFDQDEDDYYMNRDQDKSNQEFIPYGGMYPSYPMAPVNQMMPYPVVIPGNGQNQSGGNMPIQTIPIPYPMPMPMPMPMYGQYPQYPQQYPPYPPQYPPYPPQEPYGRYRDDRRENRRDDRRDSGRRFNGHRRDDRYDDRYDNRYDNRYDDRYDDRYNDRYDDRYNDRYENRYDDRYDDRRDRRADERRDGDYYTRDDLRRSEPRREESRRTVPQPPYEPPYRRQTEPPVDPPRQTAAPEPIAPIYTPQPEPVQTPAPEPEKPKFTPSPFSNFDFNFHKHADDQTSTEATAQESNSLGGFENPPENSAPDSDGINDGSFAGDGFDDSFDNDGFGDDTFANDGFGDDSAGADDFGSNSFDAPDSEEEDDFGLGFGNKSISSDRPSSFENEGSKPSGGRFKKRK